MSLKTRLRRAWEKVKFFFYRLTHPESRKKIVDSTREVLTDVKEGAVLYIKTGQMKMKKVTLSSRLRECYAELGMSFEELVLSGAVEADEKVKKLLDEIKSLKQELAQLEEEERKAALVRND